MKKFISILLAVVLCFSLSTTVFADYVTEEPMVIASGSGEAEPMVEQTEWVYRNHNGNLEKRLWSNTYGKWLTDWIYVGPALDI